MDDEGARSVQAIYSRSYGSLVAALSLLSGSRSEAEDAVQEAFVRLILNWDKVSQYDDVEGWLRCVAVRLVSSRRRKVRNQAAAVARLHVGKPLSQPPDEGVLMYQVLLSLKPKHRSVVVLVDLLDVEQVVAARELGIPLGTLKSRLNRGRAALVGALSEQKEYADARTTSAY